ncbi:unnamed protein product, partial [Cyprideis torosa]
MTNQPQTTGENVRGMTNQPQTSGENVRGMTNQPQTSGENVRGMTNQPRATGENVIGMTNQPQSSEGNVGGMTHHSEPRKGGESSCMPEWDEGWEREEGGREEPTNPASPPRENERGEMAGIGEAEEVTRSSVLTKESVMSLEHNTSPMKSMKWDLFDDDVVSSSHGFCPLPWELDDFDSKPRAMEGIDEQGEIPPENQGLEEIVSGDIIGFAPSNFPTRNSISPPVRGKDCLITDKDSRLGPPVGICRIGEHVHPVLHSQPNPQPSVASSQAQNSLAPETEGLSTFFSREIEKSGASSGHDDSEWDSRRRARTTAIIRPAGQVEFPSDKRKKGKRPGKSPSIGAASEQPQRFLS